MKRIFISFSLALILLFSMFTTTAFAEDTPLFELQPSSTYYQEFPAGAFGSPLTVGKVWVDGVLANDFNFTVNWGAQSVVFFRFVPCSYKFGPSTASLSFDDFEGYSIAFELPVYQIEPGETYGAYGARERITLTIGDLINGHALWMEDNVVFPGTVNFRRINSNSQLIFVIDARYINYPVTAYSGSYSNYSGLDLLKYICATLKYAENSLVSDPLGDPSASSYVSTNFVFDINYFPDQLTWYEKEYLQKITELGTLLEDIDSIFDDIDPPPIVKPELPPENVTPDDPDVKDDQDAALDFSGDIFTQFVEYQNYMNSLMPNFTTNQYFVVELGKFSNFMEGCFSCFISGTTLIYNNIVIKPFIVISAFTAILLLLGHFGFGGGKVG